MALIIVTEHAAKRFKQRKGINILQPLEQTKPLVAIAAMKEQLFKNKPHSVIIDGDKYGLSFSTSVEGTLVCTIHTVVTPDSVYGLKQTIKRKLIKWLNDW